MDNPKSVSVEQAGRNTYRYTFDQSIDTADLSFLMGHSSIESYDVDGKVLTVKGKNTPNWTNINDSFILPGLKRTFGSLKVDTHALTGSSR